MTGCTSWPASSPEKRRAAPSSTRASCSQRPSQPIPASGRQCKLLPMPKFRSAARTDVGMKRDHNEDSFLVNEDIGLYVVCDGMGGHAGGETASRLAVQTIEKELISAKLRIDDPFSAKASLPESPLARALREAVEGACAAVFRSSRAHPELAALGTTCISLLLPGDHAIVGPVGGTPAYPGPDGQGWQLSEGPSLVD